MRAGTANGPILALPLGWLVLFLLLPLSFVFEISLAEPATGIPPYTPIWTLLPEPTLSLTFGNYGLLASEALYIDAFVSALRIAAVSTLACVLIGYPMAYAIAAAPMRRRPVLLLLCILPFWTSFLVRVYAWLLLLKPTGLINGALQAMGLIDDPLPLIDNEFAVCLGIVYAYLPFMVLPLYANLERIDRRLLEAAADLGARPMSIFLGVTLPLSLPGILAGSLLVFIPAVGEFVIPELMGGTGTLMIGTVLWTEFFTNRDWPVASAIAVTLVVVLIVPVLAFQRSRGNRP